MDASNYDNRSQYAAAIEAATVERRRGQARDQARQSRAPDLEAGNRLLASRLVDAQSKAGIGLDGLVGRAWERIARLTRWHWIMIYALTVCVYAGAAFGLVIAAL